MVRSQVQKDNPIGDEAVLVAIGANLPSSAHGPPLRTCEAALSALAVHRLTVVRASPWYESEPVPASDQPWYVNGVVAIATEHPPADVMSILHDVEADFGRQRRLCNEARVLDLDLLAYGRRVSSAGAWPQLPHPRLVERAFVLLPLRDVAPGWRHPVSGLSVDGLIDRLSPGPAPRRLVLFRR